MVKVKIYCIVDINDSKYVGSTKLKLSYRLSNHKSQKDCSSKLLDLDNCEIILLEECDESVRKEREQYWIENTDCVNIRNPVSDIKEYKKVYHQKNKEQRNEYNRKLYHYKNSWGGDARMYNNLLLIDPSAFE